MASIGLHILLSLSNGKEYTAELDQMYSEFKGECKKSTITVAGMKMAARVKARKKKSDKDKGHDQSHDDDLVLYLEGKADSDDELKDVDGYQFEGGTTWAT